MTIAPSRKRPYALLAALVAIAAGAALRLWFIHAYPVFEGDPLIYGDIAKNWLQHGIYGLSGNGPIRSAPIRPTLIRLPGYPLFLAACFKVFGMEHYRAVMYLQTASDLGSCLLIAGFVRRIVGPRAAMIALWLAALCPFTANYVAAPLTETLSVFCVALALYSLTRLLESSSAAYLVLLSFAFSYAALLRPDGALLAVALCPAIAFYGRRQWGWARALRLAAICGMLSVLPFVPWTVRNHRTFHVFEPLAPRYAVDPGESPTPGFNRWMRTWCVEFTSTYEVYWIANADRLDIASLPSRAFDSAEQRQRTLGLFDDYNDGGTDLNPAIDARFAALATERIQGHRLRYYVELPLLRVADMWLRPRTENLNVELRWWRYDQHSSETKFAAAYAALNLAYLLAAMVGVLCWPRWPATTMSGPEMNGPAMSGPGRNDLDTSDPATNGATLLGAMLAFVLLRSILLATLEAPEPRYTLECFPVAIALAAAALARIGAPSTAKASERE